MKRLLSIILALAMIMTLIPAAFATGETTDGVTVEYSFLFGNGKTTEDITYPHTKGKIAFFVDSGGKGISFEDDYTRLNTRSGTYFAFKIRVPVSGSYTAALNLAGPHASSTKGSAIVDVYMLPVTTTLETESFTEDTLILSQVGATRTQTEYKGTTEKELAAGEYFLVFKRNGSLLDGTDIPAGKTVAENAYQHYTWLKGFTLTSGTGRALIYADMNVSDDDDAILDAGYDDTTEISFSNVYMSDGVEATEAEISEIELISSDETVATVADGTVTAKGVGTTTIQAKVGDYVLAEKEITVINSNLSGVKVTYETCVNTTDGTAKLNEYTYSNTEGTLEYFDTTSTYATKFAYEKFGNGGYNLTDATGNLRFIGQFLMATNQWVAYKMRIPATGDYTVDLIYGKSSQSPAIGSMYILPIETTDINTAIETATPIFENIDFHSASPELGNASSSFSADYAGEYYMIWKRTGGSDAVLRPARLTLNGGDGTAPIWSDVTLADDTLTVGDTTPLTSVTYMSDGETATDTTGITYTSTNAAVATIENGTVTAVGAGTAKIQAKSGDYILGEVDVTVTLPENAEYIAAFNPDSTGSETVNEVVSPLVYAKDGTKLDITPSATKNADNGTWLVSTDAESEDYKFLYWAKGLSTGVKRRIVSRSASFNYDAENEGNYLIAVYEKENMKTSGDEYYNANGQLLEDDTLPYLAGYVGAATGWEDRGDGMHVAIFPEENRAKYTITVDGTPKDYYYGDPVVCTADAEKDGKKFFGWRKTVNGAGAELVSASTSYTFNAWENCEVTAEYEDEAPVFSGVARKIVLGTFNVGSETAIMAEFIGFGNDVVERGISLNGTEIAMTTKEYNQFTIINNDNLANISGYAILADGTKVIYNK